MTAHYICSGWYHLAISNKWIDSQQLPVSCVGGAHESHLCGVWQEQLLQQ